MTGPTGRAERSTRTAPGSMSPTCRPASSAARSPDHPCQVHHDVVRPRHSGDKALHLCSGEELGSVHNAPFTAPSTGVFDDLHAQGKLCLNLSDEFPAEDWGLHHCNAAWETDEGEHADSWLSGPRKHRTAIQPSLNARRAGGAAGQALHEQPELRRTAELRAATQVWTVVDALTTVDDSVGPCFGGLPARRPEKAEKARSAGVQPDVPLLQDVGGTRIRGLPFSQKGALSAGLLHVFGMSLG